MSICRNCAWFCLSNNKCYGSAIRDELAVEVKPEQTCSFWQFDGLEDWEREPEETLMAMEEVM